MIRDDNTIVLLMERKLAEERRRRYINAVAGRSPSFVRRTAFVSMHVNGVQCVSMVIP